MAIELVLDGASSVEDQAPVTPAVTTESVLAEVEKLTPEEQNQIEQFSQKIDLHKSEIVMNYGATIQKQSASIATKTLQDVKTKNTGEVSALLVEMVGAMNGLSGGQDHGVQHRVPECAVPGEKAGEIVCFYPKPASPSVTQAYPEIRGSLQNFFTKTLCFLVNE